VNVETEITPAWPEQTGKLKRHGARSTSDVQDLVILPDELHVGYRRSHLTGGRFEIAHWPGMPPKPQRRKMPTTHQRP
jgi:hypothetical protein